MKKINVEILVPDNFKFLARDMDGKVFAFENEPELATDIACDTWDVKEGKFLPHNATLCENCDAIYPADETLFQVLLANSVSSSRSLLNANV